MHWTCSGRALGLLWACSGTALGLLWDCSWHALGILLPYMDRLARTYLQLPLRQWGARNVYLLVLSSWKVNIAENLIAICIIKCVLFTLLFWPKLSWAVIFVVWLIGNGLVTSEWWSLLLQWSWIDRYLCYVVQGQLSCNCEPGGISARVLRPGGPI